MIGPRTELAAHFYWIGVGFESYRAMPGSFLKRWFGVPMYIKSATRWQHARSDGTGQ
jgi:hypothetical protein